MALKRKRAVPVPATLASSRSRRLQPEPECVLEDQEQDSAGSISEEYMSEEEKELPGVEEDTEDECRRAKRPKFVSLRVTSNTSNTEPQVQAESIIQEQGQEQKQADTLFSEAAGFDFKGLEIPQARDVSNAAAAQGLRRSPRGHQSNAGIFSGAEVSPELGFEEIEYEPPGSKRSRSCRLSKGFEIYEQQDAHADGLELNVPEIKEPEDQCLFLKRPRGSPRIHEPLSLHSFNSEKQIKLKEDETKANDTANTAPTAIPTPPASEPTQLSSPESSPQNLSDCPDLDPNIPEMVRSRPYSGPIRARSQLASHLPPLHKLGDIFKSLTDRAIELDLDSVLNHLGGRPLRVVTVCSGTESPLLALEMVKESEYSFYTTLLGEKG